SPPSRCQSIPRCAHSAWASTSHPFLFLSHRLTQPPAACVHTPSSFSLALAHRPHWATLVSAAHSLAVQVEPTASQVNFEVVQSQPALCVSDGPLGAIWFHSDIRLTLSAHQPLILAQSATSLLKITRGLCQPPARGFQAPWSASSWLAPLPRP